MSYVVSSYASRCDVSRLVCRDLIMMYDVCLVEIMMNDAHLVEINDDDARLD